LFATLIITYVLSIPIGIYAAVKRGGVADYGLTVFSYLGLALPNFLLALVMLYFANRWFGAAVGGLFSPDYEDAPWSLAKFWDLVKHMWLPAFVLAWSAMAYQIQTVRATMSDEIGKLNVTAARARGVPEARLLVKYPARLAINPVVSTIGFDVNRIFSELPIVAAVLGLTELGDLLLKSFLDLDMNVAGAILLMLTVVIVVMNFVSDLLLAWLDPRIRLRG
jgi:peptide/nickel transport system permease protein